MLIIGSYCHPTELWLISEYIHVIVKVNSSIIHVLLDTILVIHIL